MRFTALFLLFVMAAAPTISLAQTAGSATNTNSPAPANGNVGTTLPTTSTSSNVGVGATESPNSPNTTAAAVNPNGPDFEGELDSAAVIATIVTALGALQKKNWTMFTSAVIMLMVFAFDMFWVKNLPDNKRNNILPWLAILVGCILQFAATLASTGNWGQAVNMAFITGTSASGLWSLIGKQVIGRLAPASAAANPNRQTTAVP